MSNEPPSDSSDEIDPVVRFAMRVLARLELSRDGTGSYLDAIEHAQRIVIVALGEVARD